MNKIFRIFLQSILHFKMAVALKIFGLPIAFAEFMVIMMKLDFYYGFDKYPKNYDRIFRVEILDVFQSLKISTPACPLA